MMEYYQNTYFHCSSLIAYIVFQLKSQNFIEIIFQALIRHGNLSFFSIQCLLRHKMKLSKSQVHHHR